MSHLLVNDLVSHTAYLSFPRAVRHFRSLQLVVLVQGSHKTKLKISSHLCTLAQYWAPIALGAFTTTPLQNPPRGPLHIQGLSRPLLRRAHDSFPTRKIT
mgnify:CR=1 FL=1